VKRLAIVVFAAFVAAAPLGGSILPALPSPTVQAQAPPAASQDAAPTRPAAADQEKPGKRGEVPAEAPDTETQLQQLIHAMVRLPVAAGLASLLALRPRRRGTPRRQPPVIQTQIILAIVGAVVMLVVGSSLARAFGIVGAAGLVRYRAKIDDPKDAGVMLSTLSIGLAAGVGVWMLAAFATAFIMGVLWVIESFEPKARNLFTLTVKAKSPDALKGEVEALLRRHHVKFELRSESPEQICYETRLPLEVKTDRVSQDILDLNRETVSAVQWEEKKEKK
jgi:hypothetical protein